MRYERAFVVVLIYVFLLLFIMADISMAQPQPPSPNQIDTATRESSRPVRDEIEKKMIKAPKRPAKIKEDLGKASVEGPKFFVKEINLMGVTAFSVADFKPIIAKYENREVSMGELDILAKEIEREYLRRGVIAASFVPPQDVKEGKVVIRVIEAKMGKIEVKPDRWFSPRRVEYYWTIPAGEILRYDKLSRTLQMMNKNPDRTVKAALHAGDKPETTDVMLDMQTGFPVHITATVDHEGTPSTGKLRKGFGFVDNNFLGCDDTLLGGYTGGKNFGGVYVYHRLPITPFGTSLLYGYSKSKSFPQKDYAPYEINSTSESYSMYIYQDLFYKDEYKGELSFGGEANNKRTVSGAQGDLNVDRLRILSTGLTLMDRSSGNVTSVKPAIYQGINGLGAQRINEFSSRDAGNTFTRVNLNASMRQAYIKNFQASMKFTGQIASEKLTPQEELYIGGIDSVRGYPSGDYLADTGFYSQMELIIPAFFVPEWVRVPYGEHPIKDEITGVAFFDIGYGYKRGDIQGEQSFRRMAGAGGGVRAKILNQATVRVEIGAPLNPTWDGPLTEWERVRIHFSVDFQDDVFDEAERFQKKYREEYIKNAAWRIVDSEMKKPDSQLTQTIYSNLFRAKSAYSAGELVEAKRYYSIVAGIGNNVYKQTVAYLTENYNYSDELRKDNEAAKRFLRDGEIEKAYSTWQKVSQTRSKPLVLEFIEYK